MKRLIRVALALVVLALVFGGIRLLLPTQFHVERSVVIVAAAEGSTR